MMSPDHLFGILCAHPFPGTTDLRMSSGACCFTAEHIALGYTHNGWISFGRVIPDEMPHPSAIDAAQVHAEIRRVLAIVNAPTETSPTRATIKADCAGQAPYIPTLAEIADEPPLEDALHDRLTDEIDRRRDVESQLATITDTHAVVSQRLIGSQKEVAERDATIDELRGALEAIAAHVGLVGSDRWAVEVIKIKVGEVAVKAGAVPALEKSVARLTSQRDDWQADIDRARRDADEATARADKVENRLRRDDKLREQIAVAVGLDGSASLALILDTVTRDRPAREISRLSGLLDVFAAPVAFGERRLSTVERAEWALRRALRERDECAPRMAQLIDAEVCLDTLGVPAHAAIPSDDPGDASEALTVAERIRLHFGAQS